MEDGAIFSFRMNCLDHYQAVPTEFDPPVPRSIYESHNGKDKPRVSVIRCFGATSTGQKMLAHIHGAFQYTYIEYTGSLVTEDVEAAIRTLSLSIDHALAVSYRKNIYDGKHQYVAHVSLVKGVPFYGYHVGYKFYLKIYLLNPLHMTRLADLLREGAVMKRALQPYESHMQYLAQWMCDYNIYGCAYIDCSKVKFRSPVPAYHDLVNSLHLWHDHSISEDMISDETLLPRQSHCTLEVDVCVQDIRNRHAVEPRSLHHDFIERLRPLPLDFKFVQSMAGLWKDETRRRKTRMGLNDADSSPFPPEVLITMSADPRNTDPGGWIHEEEFRERIAQLAAQENKRNGGNEVSFDHFVQFNPLGSTVQTALQSVEDLYPCNMQKLIVRERATGGNSNLQNSQAIVDETRISHSTTTDPDDLNDLNTRGARHTDTSSGGQAIESISSNSTVKSPISSGEYAKLGIRQAGDLTHVHEDEFEVPQNYVEERDPVWNGTKRVRTDKEDVSKSKKRRKVLIDEDDYLHHLLFSGSENEGELFDGRKAAHEADHDDEVLEILDELPEPQLKLSPQKSRLLERSSLTASSLNRKGAQKSKLSFSVVKNPNDPIALQRLSQQSASSQKSSPAKMSPQKLMTSFPISSAATRISQEATTEKTPQSARSDESSRSKLLSPLSLKGTTLSSRDREILVFQVRAPTARHVQESFSRFGLPHIIHQDAYYGKEEDVPDRQREYAGREFKLESNTIPYLPDFDPAGTSAATFGRKAPVLLDTTAEDLADHQRRRRSTIKHWSIGIAPPSRADVVAWLEISHEKDKPAQAAPQVKKPEVQSQIDLVTQRNKHGYKYSQHQDSTSVQHETQYMSMMSVEVHVNTRGSLAPNPEEDQISCIFWCVQTDDDAIQINTNKEGMRIGVLVVSDDPLIGRKIARSIAADVEQEDTELNALTRMADIVRQYDPDILTGYEVHNSSWGYLIERARLKYDLNFCDEISRMKSQSHGRFGKDEDRWGFNHTSTVRVTGRHTINIWRAMRGELNLLQYTMENVVFHLLHQRIPHYSFADLTEWYRGKNPRNMSKVLEYFASRAQLDIAILEANELVPRTSEQARLLGVDWFSVISRGSQFKVESLMFRIAKPENFILVSPSRRQVGGQNALECLPLVMEPQSDFYSSPMLVLDFQSLYPSIVIAYNYCYSTFLGRVVDWRGTNKMGFSHYHRQERLIELLKDHINIAPNGMMYAKTEVRKSLLAKMLSEILETRVMVKSGMKIDKDDRTLQQLLNNRQLALKLIANVTYGYTSASFSGRMPCSEIADSIVQTGRETLEKAIALIHSVQKWGAEVVYGDTDSLFVYLKGRTREQAFDIGEEIAAAITKVNPRPIKLKFEKVYHPCVLLAKKRYVGFKYEHRSQKEPDFEAKGIETVRRDGTPAEQKIEENALKILFRGADLSQVKAFFQAQCAKIMQGKVSIQDFCFAKEVKLGTYSDKGPPPPGALISARRMLEDPRLEPQYGERVPYVVVTGGPGARLIDRCVAPDVLLNDAQSELDAEYYISKNIIPPLERIFNLVGANIRQWFDEMPKYQRIRRIEAGLITDGMDLGLSKKTLESYMKSSTCLVCREALDTEAPLCNSCFRQGPQSLMYLQARLIKAQRKAAELVKVCRSCSGLSWSEEIRCDSKDCPVFYSRTRQTTALANEKAQILPVLRLLEYKQDSDIDW